METLEEFLALGEEIYGELLKHKDIQFIVCPASLGDTVNVGAFALTYKRIHNVKTLILVVKSHHVSLASIFPGVDQAFELSDEEMLGLRIYMTVRKKEKSDNVLYGYFPMKDDRLGETANARLTSFVDEYKATILDIPLDSTIDSVRIQKPKDAFRYKEAVLIMPFSRTISKCRDKFWEALIQHLRDNGQKKIYTNIGNSEDYPLEGTEKLELDAPELLAYSNQFKKIIGVRSGIFDVLALRDDVILDVITTGIESRFWGKCEIDTHKHPLYFGLTNLNPNAIVKEYSYTVGCDDSLIEEILC